MPLSWLRCWPKRLFGAPEGTDGTVDDVWNEPDVAHYIAGWPHPGDLGVVAEDRHPVGAAWLQFFTPSDPGYGFVDSDTPEISMGISGVPECREHGIGTRLLDALIQAAREAGLAALSLSVEPDNYARGLYERAGFRQVGRVDGSLTMLLQL